MAGVPLVLGFVAKEAVFEAFDRGSRGIGSHLSRSPRRWSARSLTVAYSLRFAMGATRLPARAAGSALAADVSYGPPPRAGSWRPASCSRR